MTTRKQVVGSHQLGIRHSVGGYLRRLLRLVAAPLRAVLIRGAIALSERQMIEGVEVVDLSVSDHDPQGFKHAAKVLRLIGQYDPRRLRRLKQDVRRIMISHTGGIAGAYWASVRACVLDSDHLASNPASAAMTLVHEATHARLALAGIVYTPRLRERIERRCLEEEISFGQRLPESDELIAEARGAMAKAWWASGDQNERVRQELKTLRWPRWLIRIGDLLFRE